MAAGKGAGYARLERKWYVCYKTSLKGLAVYYRPEQFIENFKQSESGMETIKCVVVGDGWVEISSSITACKGRVHLKSDEHLISYIANSWLYDKEL